MIKLAQLLEDADASKMDTEKFPKKLSQVDATMAKLNVVGGEKDGEQKDDTIAVKEAMYPVSKLKPSQSSMNIGKAMGMAIGMINKVGPFKNGPGGDLGCFISNDFHIMDGHHRWIASAMVDPNSKVGGFIVNFPGSELIAVLNTLTVGAFGELKGKAASGGFDQFKEAPIRKQLETLLAAPTEYTKPEDIQSAIETFTGKSGDEAKEAAIALFVKNVSALTLSVPDGAPERPDMPIIDEPNVPKAVDALKKGKVDVNPPYANEALIKEHFQKIAKIKR
tara:strand:- start:107 stop:943 length:837 start_codon:yes stop_codon:yes gene_type:complete